ncbi:MAG: class I SAM-dependent methyltransferase [Acidimicrobiia bacterium]|nr:class I SAM-dependent methyltransferase [Acidimicrobiia bacterium]
MSQWDDLADWWVDEVADPAYEFDVQPLVDALVADLDGPSLDLGCGTGRLYATMPQPAFGCDSSGRLLAAAAAKHMPVVQARIPDLAALRDGTFSCAVACLVVEHLPNIHAFFTAAARVVRDGGHLVVVSNHPAYTSAGAGPLIDQSDGEVLWRWGTYFFESIAAEPAGEGSIVFHHRPLATIVNSAAQAGWVLEQMLEAGASEQTIARIPSLVGQDHMPRLIALRWKLL